MTGLPALDPDVTDLGLALGLLTPSPNGPQLDASWFDDPKSGLTTMLSDDGQRGALVDLLERVLAGGDHTESGGVTLLPILDLRALAGSTAVPEVVVQLSIDDSNARYVEVGIAATVQTSTPFASSTHVIVPLYRAAKPHAQPAVTQAFALLDGGVISFGTDLTFSTSPPATDAFGLGGVSVTVQTALKPTPDPQFTLTLKNLHLPGATESRDVTIHAGPDLEQDLLSVVLGLVRQAADSLGAAAGAEVMAALALLGLTDGGAGLPPLPVDDLVHRGVAALRDWFTAVLRDHSAAWLQQLAALLGLPVGAVSDTSLNIPLGMGPVTATLGFTTATGPGGHLTVTPSLALGLFTDLASVHVGAEARVDLFTVDTSDGSLTALPQVDVAATATGLGAAKLLTAAPATIGSVRTGLTVRHGQPQFLLQALDVDLPGGHHDVVDLSTPDAVVAEAGHLASGVIADALDALGPAADDVRTLLGLGAVAPVDGTLLMSDPLGALAARWHGLLTGAAADVTTVLTALQDLLVPAAGSAVTSTGPGAWTIPLVDGFGLDVSMNGDELGLAASWTLDVADFAGGSAPLSTSLRVRLLTVDLIGRHGHFPLSVELAAAVGGGAHPPPRIPLSPTLAITADSAGVAASWSPGSPFTVGLAVPDLALESEHGPIPLVLPTIDAGGHIAVPAGAWDSVEKLVGVLAASASQQWLTDLAALAGWQLDDPALGTPLSLAALVSDPEPTLRAWLGSLISDPTLLDGLVRALANALGSTTTGSGTPDDPWLAPLGTDPALPSLAIWMTPDGPAAARVADQAVAAWTDGSPGLAPDVLLAALQQQSGATAAALAAGRDALAPGIQALLGRWGGTDGLVAPPPGQLAGVTAITRPGVDWSGLARLDVAAATGAALAPTVVRVAVGPVDGLPWPTAAGVRVLDLTQPGVGPGSFLVATPMPGEYHVALAPRADAGLGTTADPSGLLGQSGRLIQILRQLAGQGDITLVALGGAGHAARLAASAVDEVTQLVTLGTPWSPLTFDDARTGTTADAVRLLRALLPPAPAGGTDLALGRTLVDGFLDAARFGPAVADLEAPRPDVALGAGQQAYAVFGVLAPDAVSRAVTAVVAAGITALAAADDTAHTAPTATWLGVRAPLPVHVPPGGHGIEVTGTAMLALGSVASNLAVTAAPALTLDLAIADTDHWLIGGPGTTAAAALPAELRRVAVHAEAGLHGTPSRVDVVLYEGSALGADWTVLPVLAPDAATGTYEPQPLLPEARALLNVLLGDLAAAPAGSPAAVLAVLLRAVGISDADGALVPDALTYLLHAPAEALQALLASPDTAAVLLTALAPLVPGLTVAGSTVSTALGPVTVTADLTTRTVSADARGTAGPLPWTATATLAPTPTGGTTAVTATLGDPVGGPLVLSLTSGPTTAQLAIPGSAPVALYPTPDVTGLVRLAAVALPAEAVRAILAAVRPLNATAGAAIDAVCDALGILAPPDAHGVQAIRPPVQLFSDPHGWLARAGVLSATGGAFDTTKIAGLLDAAKPFLGIGGAPGTWSLAAGIVLSVGAGADGPTLALDVDADAWLGGAAASFAAGLTAGLSLPANAAPRPAVDLYLGLPGTSGVTHPGAVHVSVTGAGIEALLRPRTAPDVELYPHPAGLGALLAAGVTQVLPTVLDALIGMTGGALGDVAALVAAVGDGLDLRTTAGSFDPAALSALAAAPEQWLVQHATTLLGEAATALNPLLDPLVVPPAGQHVVAVSGGVVTITVRTVTITIHPNPLTVSVAGNVTGLPVVDAVTVAMTAGAAGLTAWSAEIGPAAIPLASGSGGPTVRPFVRTDFTTSAGWEFDLGLDLDGEPPATAGHQDLEVRWRSATAGFTVLAPAVGSDPNLAGDPATVALAAVDAVLDLVGTWVLGVADVQSALNTHLGTGTDRVGDVLANAVLNPRAPGDTDPCTLVPGVVRGWPAKLVTIGANLAGFTPHVTIATVLTVGLTSSQDGTDTVLGISLGLADPLPLTTGDTVLSLEADSSWIDGSPPAGITLDLLRVGNDATFTPALGLAVDGVGLRLAKASGPLIDEGLRLESVAVHLLGSVVSAPAGRPTLAGGAQLELTGLAVPLGSGGDQQNAVAGGIMNDAGGSGAPPRPAFSPALAVQYTEGQPAPEWSFRAGSGAGPWYLPIQRAFGPVYLEQIGLGVTYTSDAPKEIDLVSLYLDGDVSLLGLTASVQNLRIGYHWGNSFVDPSSWQVDVDGFAIAADFGPLSLAGGLVKFPVQDAQGNSGLEYLGMLKLAYAGYGLDLFGGYAHPTSPDGAGYASFFAFGVLHAPLGGVPAFFVTGAGLGFGINRELTTPTIDTVATNPFMVALKATGPTPDPMQQLLALRDQIAPHKGEYWVAAGISFTSFVLVTGEILVTVQFGDGLEIAVLGLARAQLPTADLTLVSIELALLARFSTRDGLLLVQAQLTENSWVLDKSVHLTGGFAFETWWKGPNAGQFVITIGGYHPRFSHDGYPQVPRVGLSWQPADEISVVGGAYFALCSEAIMAGVALHAAAHLGPAHATLDLGADGLVLFDPFYFVVSVYAHASVGITIWLLFGSVDLDFSLGFDVTVEGPPIYIHGSFSVCGVGIPFSIGSQGDPAERALTADSFADKYLRGGAGAQVVQASTGKGALTAGAATSGGAGAVAKPPDGSPANPFRVVPEFTLTFVTTAPTRTLVLSGPDGPPVTASTSGAGLGFGPMLAGMVDSTLTVTFTRDGGGEFSIDDALLTPRPATSFPKGAWGEAQNPDALTMPSGDTVDAPDGLVIDTTRPDSALTGSAPVDYHQVELPVSGRRPLPFVTNRAQTDARVAAAAQLTTAAQPLTGGDPDAATRYVRAAEVLRRAGTGLTTVSALRGDRVAPPTFGTLADDLADSPDTVSPATTPSVVPAPVAPTRPLPIVKAVLGAPQSLAVPGGGTTVAEPGDATQLDPPTLAGVRAATAGLSQLALHLVPRAAQAMGTDGAATLLATGSAPVSRLASGALGAVANARATAQDTARLHALTAALTASSVLAPHPTIERAIVADGDRPVDRVAVGPVAHSASAAPRALLHEGELAVITIAPASAAPVAAPAPARPDTLTVAGGPTRILSLAAGGRVLDDVVVGTPGLAAPGTTPMLGLPPDTERVVVVALGTQAGAGGSTAGWDAGQALPSVGWGVALGGGVTVTTQGARVPRNRQRADGGWVGARQLATAAVVVTTFADPVTAVAVVVDDAASTATPGTAASGATPAGTVASRVSMRLGDAERVVDDAGDPLPPQVLVAGVRSVLLYAVTPTGPHPRVIVDGCGGGQLAAVLGGTTGVADLAAVVAGAGPAAAVRQPLVGGPGARRLQLVPGEAPVLRPRPPVRPPVPEPVPEPRPRPIAPQPIGGGSP